MQPTIAITGGTGFVGKGIVEAVLASGYTVRALVRNERSAEKLSFLSSELRAKLQLVYGDPCKSEDMERLLAGSDVVLHLVGIRRHEIKKTGKTYEDIDLGSVLALIKAMHKLQKKRVILLSAGAIGNSIYVQTKAKAERAIIEADLDHTIFRPAFITAPGQQWPIFMAPFLTAMSYLPGKYGDISRRAGNISRKQLASAFINAIKDDSTIGKIYDVPELRKLGK